MAASATIVKVMHWSTRLWNREHAISRRDPKMLQRRNDVSFQHQDDKCTIFKIIAMLPIRNYIYLWATTTK